jgi:hypothetical protein
MELYENRGVAAFFGGFRSGTSQKAEQKPVHWIGVLA